MEPAYSKSDVLLIEKQSLVNIEKIGIFMIDGDILKSHNAIYDAIWVANQTVCLGKALGQPMMFIQKEGENRHGKVRIYYQQISN